MSVPVTVKVWLPTVDVSRLAPFATVPVHVSIPDSRSVHLYAAVTTFPSGNDSPSAGRVDVTDGLTASTLNATSFVLSTCPATSVAWNCTKWLPVENPLIGPLYTCEAPP